MLELRKAAVQGGGVRGDPVRPLSLPSPERNEEMQKTAQPSQQAPETIVSHPRHAKPFDLAVPPWDGHSETGPCPFSHGLPVSVSDIKTDKDFTTIPLCYPMELAPRPDRQDVMYPAGPAPAQLTCDQRLAASILHAYVREQHDQFKKRGEQQRPRAPSGFASPAGSGAVDVEAPFTPHAMEQLQQSQPPTQLTQKLQKQKAQAQNESVKQEHRLQKRQQPQQPTDQPSQQQQLKETPDLSKDASRINGDISTGGKPSGTRAARETDAERQSTGTRVMPQKQSQATARPPSAPQPSEESRMTAAKDDQSCSNSGKSQEQHVLNAVAETPAAPQMTEDAMRPSDPPPRIDENTVVRDLRLLQQKKKVLFRSGSSGADSPKVEVSGPEGETHVDLS